MGSSRWHFNKEAREAAVNGAERALGVFDADGDVLDLVIEEASKDLKAWKVPLPKGWRDDH